MKGSVPIHGDTALTRSLLRIETVLTFPFFLLAWMVSTGYHALKAGWGMPLLKESEKADLLDRVYGRRETDKVDDHESN